MFFLEKTRKGYEHYNTRNYPQECEFYDSSGSYTLKAKILSNDIGTFDQIWNYDFPYRLLYRIDYDGDQEFTIYYSDSEKTKKMKITLLCIPVAEFNLNIVYKPGRYTILVDKHYRKMLRKTKEDYLFYYRVQNINLKRCNRYKSWKIKLKHPYYFAKRLIRKWLY
jgi:hypothetical protein